MPQRLVLDTLEVVGYERLSASLSYDMAVYALAPPCLSVQNEVLFSIIFSNVNYCGYPQIRGLYECFLHIFLSLFKCFQLVSFCKMICQLRVCRLDTPS